jgi:hypothetical protein
VNKITITLLGGTAVCALATAPAIAAPKHPAMHVTALHAGHAVNKTQIHNDKATKVTYTFGVYTYDTSGIGVSQHLYATFYKWNSSFSLCTAPKMKIKIKKSPTHGTAGTATETYSYGCSDGPTKFYGDTYDQSQSASSDSLVSLLKGKFKESGAKYKGKLYLDVSITIE